MLGETYHSAIRRKDIVLTMVFLGTFLIMPLMRRDFHALVINREETSLIGETEMNVILSSTGLLKEKRPALSAYNGRFKNPVPSKEEIKRLESTPIKHQVITKEATTLPPVPAYKYRNVTRLRADYVSQVVPPVIHIYKPTYDKVADAKIANEIEEIQVHEILKLPTNASYYPKVYKTKEVFHIIKTRFMQHQPKLVDLGKARLELFKTFCLPSMIHQVSQNFFWIIYTDPDLDKHLMEEMKKLLEPYPHFYLIPSLNSKRGQGGKDITRFLKPEDFIVGDVNMLYANLKNINKLAVLESRFDADDALHIKYIEEVQRRANDVFIKEKGGRDWMFWCINQAVEWHWVGPESRKSLQTYGALVTSRDYSEDKFCHTPGLTVGFARGTYTRTVAKAPHHLLYDTLKAESLECGVNYNGTDCIDFITNFAQCALRSRTPTSASMANVNSLGPKLTKQAADRAVERWDQAIRDFALLPESTKATNVYFKENIRQILHDAELGQCTPDHSCQNEAKAEIEALVALFAAKQDDDESTT